MAHADFILLIYLRVNKRGRWLSLVIGLIFPLALSYDCPVASAAFAAAVRRSRLPA